MRRVVFVAEYNIDGDDPNALAFLSDEVARRLTFSLVPSFAHVSTHVAINGPADAALAAVSTNGRL